MVIYPNNYSNFRTIMEVIMKNKWLLCILLMLFLPFGLFAQVAPPLEKQKTETQEAPENNNEVTTNSDTNTDGDAGKTIKGVINDEQGETIIGASVIIKGEDTGTTSDMDGRFTLEAPEGAILVISYIGYHTQEVKVRKRSLLRVVLKEDNQLLDEVVVVGYGTVKKSDLTGAVSGVSNRQYKNQPVQRVENILQGRTPGVEVTATSGMPGASMKVRVRGTTSINKSSDPLYVIDGIISSSGLDGINPSDIQSMEILKDASSTAIYGSRGSNGVILITTKQGSEGKAQVTFDASIGLSTVRKWGYFPSAAVAWDIAQESFMSNQHVLDQLKLRASFGVTGNQDIAAYSTLGMLSGASYGWGTSTSSTGYWGYQFATPGITWEKTYQYDLGLDMSIGGFNITVDWFKKQTKDLLFQKQVPKYNGGGTYWVNQGKLNNTGVELSLTTFPVKGAVTWETSLNASYVKNEVADLAGDDFVLTANYSDLGGPMQIMKPGYPMGSFYVYQWKGFDDKGANLYQKADGSLTTNPTSDDLVVKGQASPKWTVGWNNTVTWKNWTLNVFFNAATGYDRLNISRFMAASMTGVSRFVTLRDAYFKGWDHVANKADALYPSLTNTDNKSYANSDFWLEDASFIKLKNISLSYRIPRRVLKFASVQLSVSAQDLFTITRYKGMDPEVYTSYDGLDYGAYPIPRTITFGAKIRF